MNHESETFEPIVGIDDILDTYPIDWDGEKRFENEYNFNLLITSLITHIKDFKNTVTKLEEKVVVLQQIIDIDKNIN